MKRTIALLSAVTMLTGTGAMGLQANAYTPETATSFEDGVMYAIPLQASDKAGYDLHERIDIAGHDPLNHKYIHMYEEHYYQFTNDGRSRRYVTYSPEFNYICIRTDSEQAAKAVQNLLGDVSAYQKKRFGLSDTDLCYYPNDSVDYSTLYQIDGVKQVEKIKPASCEYYYSKFKGLTFANDDVWGQAMDYVSAYGAVKNENNLMMSVVYTEPYVQLTEEMLADTGYTVEHIYQVEEDTWYVYYQGDGSAEACYAFNDAVRQKEGILDAQLYLTKCWYTEDMSTFIEIMNPKKVAAADMNGNGELDLSDTAEILSQYAADATQTDVTTEEELLGDLDGDGQVSMMDADMALTMYAKIAAGLME